MDDYISRQATIQAFENADKDIIADYGERYGCECGFSTETVNQTINNTPSADVKPVVYARWEYDEFGCYCSGCHEYAVEVYGEPHKTSYCPECGAEMIGF